MDWMYLFFFLLAVLMAFGAKCCARGEWNEEYTSLRQVKILQGFTALGIALHHMAQKTCAPWHPWQYTVHGLDVFIPMGYMFVGVFLFGSGLGLYKSFKTKPGYLKGFIRRRIVPVVIAFYLSEFIYTAVRLAMGERMDALTIVWYLSGLHMANFNAWYVIVIPFFYLVFWAAFRFCKREGRAIFFVFLFTLGYTVLGACIDHQNDWWMRGEWWYNSILLFPLGLLFGKFEKRVTACFKKGYLIWLILSFAGIFLLFQQSEWLNAHAWGYYDAWFNPMKVPHRLMSAAFQWLVTVFYVAFCFLLMLKIKFGNKALQWLGSVTLSFYLMHGIFVELFGYNFLDISRSLVYIKNVPLYILAVLGCSVPATVLFHLLWKALVRLTGRKEKKNQDGERRGKLSALREEHRRQKRLAPKEPGKVRRFLVPGAAILLLLGFLTPSLFRGDGKVLSMNGLEFRMPADFTRRYSDSRYASWEYTGTGKKPGIIILDADIRGDAAQNFSKAEDVMAACDWMTEMELYVNPQGVRMVRGFADYSGQPERRYYIETKKAVLLLCMIEDERYYDPADCEEAMQQAADNVRAPS